jgi:hypothetical protein
MGYGPPPRRSNTGLIIGIVVVVVLAVVGIIGMVFVLRGNDAANGPTQPQGQPSLVQPTESAPSTPAADAPRLTEATALAGKFVGFLNANKQKEAAALGCAGSKQLLPTTIMLIVDESTKLKLSGKPIVEEPGTTAYPMRMDLVPISGKTRFGPMSGAVRLEDVSGQPLCVRLFELK